MRRRRQAWLAGFALQALAGCASAPPPPSPPPPGPATVFILLANDSGQAGQITVSAAGGARQLTRVGDAIRVTTRGGEAEASAPFSMPSEDVARVFGPALAAQPGPPAGFLLYFEDDSDVLTAESRGRLAEVVRSVADRRAVDVSIVGHTDTVGTRGYNFRLGMRRAQRVQEAIRALPIDDAIVRVDSHGKDAPLVATGDNVPEPRNRRVEVTVR